MDDFFEMTGHAEVVSDDQVEDAGRARANDAPPLGARAGAPAHTHPAIGGETTDIAQTPAMASPSSPSSRPSPKGAHAAISRSLETAMIAAPRATDDAGLLKGARKGQATLAGIKGAGGDAAPDTHPAIGGETTAKEAAPAMANDRAPSSRPSPKGAHAASLDAPEAAMDAPPRATDDAGQTKGARKVQTSVAGIKGAGGDATPDTIDHGQRSVARKGRQGIAVVDQEGGQDENVGNDQPVAAPLPSPLDATPLVQEIVETWRRKQAFVEARRKLILQGRALCRRMTGGDKAAADVIYAAAAAGTDPEAMLLIGPMLAAQEPLTREIAAGDRHMVKLAKGLPVAEWALAQKGFGLPGLAKTVGELGDLSAYHRGVAGVWKRAGLAVIDGGRQRKVAGDAALLHGYAPARRSTFWNIAAAVLKAQGTGENSGPWRLIYDARKAIEIERVETAGHAHNRAMRYMTKRLLRELHREWRNAG